MPMRVNCCHCHNTLELASYRPGAVFTCPICMGTLKLPFAHGQPAQAFVHLPSPFGPQPVPPPGAPATPKRSWLAATLVFGIAAALVVLAVILARPLLHTPPPNTTEEK